MMRPLTGWQRANVLAAAQYLREILDNAPSDHRARTVYEGLLEAVEPARRAVRQQREMATAAKAAVTFRDKRKGTDRRPGGERRRVNLGPPGGIERRNGDRRVSRDRRSGRTV
jgi:hypothetical protein